MSAPDRCFHCDLPLPPDARWPVTIDGVTRPMCCPGCQAVARAIVNGGLDDFYRYRTEPATRPDDKPEQLERYTLPEIAARYLKTSENDLVTVSLLVSGITCAACVWLLERSLKDLNGVQTVHVNYSTHRAQITFDPQAVSLAEILRRIKRVGYDAQPYDETRHDSALREERKQRLKRLGVAGLLAMQIMMLATALYFGEHEGMDPLYRSVLRWTSFLLCVPVVLYCATPFYRKAWFNLRRGYAGMDLPVSLGISIAFAGSVIATWTGIGQVYFESVAMFVFFLLGARYLEFMARQRAGNALDGLTHAAPATALRITREGQYETVSADGLSNGDRIVVRPGDAFPADGTIVSGSTSVDESLLSGESIPLAKTVGDNVLGGSNNVDGSVEMEITRTGEQTVLSRVLQLAEQAYYHKPRTALLTDRIAHWFVIGVLVFSAGTAIVWWYLDPNIWWAVTVSVLVVTCPCALSLATPAALVSAINALTRAGLVVVDSDALEKLSATTHVVFDKTGTLTQGRFSVQEICNHTPISANKCLHIAAALEQHSNHPIARAICGLQGSGSMVATEIEAVSGAGIAGTIGGERYYLGNLGWITEHIGESEMLRINSDQTLVYLSDAKTLLATIVLEDPLRYDSGDLIATLKQAGYKLSICSGDHQIAVARVADALNVSEFLANQRPEDKLEYIRNLQKHGETVLAVGDGVNDAPLLAAADASIAVNTAAPLAQLRASVVLLNENLAKVSQSLNVAGRTMRIIKQNLLWALGYNLCALPAAMLGWVPPWLAALGMSLSSLVVVANASRLNRAVQTGPDQKQIQCSPSMTTASALPQGSV